jgi:hypothetical protein
MGVKRSIEPKMVDFLEAKMKDNGLYQHALANKDPRTIFLIAAQVCVGIREVGGNNSGPMVELIQETIGGHSREAWCMAFVQTCLAFAELKTGIQSPIFVSEGCDQVWTSTDKKFRVKRIPAPGAIIIWGHYNKAGKYTGGHTGILSGWSNNLMTAFEGNTESGVVGGKVERDGGGVYFTNRSPKGNGNMKVRGYLIPFSKDTLSAV